MERALTFARLAAGRKSTKDLSVLDKFKWVRTAGMACPWIHAVCAMGTNDDAGAGCAESSLQMPRNMRFLMTVAGA